jgi:DNA-binding MarR family transcriptional regulator
MPTDPATLHTIALSLCRQGLSVNQFGALTALSIHGPLPSVRIAQIYGLSTAALVRIMDTLTRRGLIHRLPHTDRRERLSAITPAGQQLLDSITTPAPHEIQSPASVPAPTLSTAA